MWICFCTPEVGILCYDQAIVWIRTHMIYILIRSVWMMRVATTTSSVHILSSSLLFVLRFVFLCIMYFLVHSLNTTQKLNKCGHIDYVIDRYRTVVWCDKYDGCLFMATKTLILPWRHWDASRIALIKKNRKKWWWTQAELHSYAEVRGGHLASTIQINSAQR